MRLAAAMTRLTIAGAFSGAIARVPTRAALPAWGTSSSPVSVSTGTSSVDSGISASSPERALTPPGRTFAEAAGAATRVAPIAARNRAQTSAAVRLRRATFGATPGTNGIHYLLREPAGLAVGLALKDLRLHLEGGLAPKTWFPRSRPLEGRDSAYVCKR